MSARKIDERRSRDANFIDLTTQNVGTSKKAARRPEPKAIPT
jgi:hypothetical protein